MYINTITGKEIEQLSNRYSKIIFIYLLEIYCYYIVLVIILNNLNCTLILRAY